MPLRLDSNVPPPGSGRRWRAQRANQARKGGTRPTIVIVSLIPVCQHAIAPRANKTNKHLNTERAPGLEHSDVNIVVLET